MPCTMTETNKNEKVQYHQDKKNTGDGEIIPKKTRRSTELTKANVKRHNLKMKEKAKLELTANIKL